MSTKTKRAEIFTPNLENPQPRILNLISRALLGGEVFIIPTDSVYALVADLNSKKAIDRLYQIKEMPKKKPLALQVKDISQASEYIRNIDNEAFRLLKQITPGPYTLVFQANKRLPNYSLRNTNSIGIRISANPVMQGLLDIHPNPLVSTSVITDDEYIIDIDQLRELYSNQVSGIVDGGIMQTELSTVLEFQDDGIHMIRAGKGSELVEQILD